MAKKKPDIPGTDMFEDHGYDFIKEGRSKYGRENIVLGTDLDSIDLHSTGCLALDAVIGGMPLGRISEIYGTEGGGKSTTALCIAAAFQKTHPDGYVYFIDAENRLDTTWATKNGVDLARLYVSQPTTAEEACQMVIDSLQDPSNCLVIVDSIPALIPKAELEGEMENQQVGLQARILGKFLRKAKDDAKVAGIPIILINQIREKVGVVFGNPETTPGGRAPRFWSTVRLDIRRIKRLKKGDNQIGIRSKIKVIKSSVGGEGRTCEFQVGPMGFDYAGDLFDTALALGILEKTGSTYYFGGEKLGVGKEKVLGGLTDEMRSAIVAAVGEKVAEGPTIIW